MNICSIICEYNPFHKGHKHHIETVKKGTNATHIVCVMSGNYVQRGDVAIYSKHYRAQCAVEGGADLVVEIPTPYVLSSAQYFAQAGVFIAKQLGSTMLSFGSECGDIDALKKAAHTLTLPTTQNAIRCNMSKGFAYHSAVSLALSGNLADFPNNTLGIEYIKAAPELEFHTIKRTFAHDAPGSGSASDIRERIKAGLLSPEQEPHFLSYNEKGVLSALRKLSAYELSEISGCSEGLNNRLYRAVRSSVTLDQIFSLTASKRYPLSRIRRYVLCAYLDIKKDFPQNPTYIRVLAISERGREILSHANTNLPIITKSAKSNSPLFQKESRFTDLYELFSKISSPCGSEYRNSVYLKKDNKN